MLLLLSLALAAECPWAGPNTPVVEALRDHVTINGVEYAVDAKTERATFAGYLHDCNAEGAVLHFVQWQQFRDWAYTPGYALRATALRNRFVDELSATTPPRK